MSCWSTPLKRFGRALDILWNERKWTEAANVAVSVEPGATTAANGGQVPAPQLRSKEDTTNQQENIGEFQALKGQEWSLELDNKVKDQLLLRAREEKEEDRKDLLAYSHRIDELEMENVQLKRLNAGQPTLDDNKETQTTEARIIDPEPPASGERLQDSEKGDDD